jgi:Fic family protein
LNETERLEVFLESFHEKFTRKDYMKYFREISTATASRDLKNGVENGLIEKFGDKKTTYYKKKSVLD